MSGRDKIIRVTTDVADGLCPFCHMRLITHNDRACGP